MLLASLREAIEAARGTDAGRGERLLDAWGLGVKYWFHAATVQHLADGTNATEPAGKFFDFASVTVIARATLETFLVFHHLFVDPLGSVTNEDFRHGGWVLADLLARQQFPASSSHQRELLGRERQRIEALKLSLTANPVFQSLSSRQQRALLNRGKWRWKREPTGRFTEARWRDLALAAGLSHDYAVTFQSFGSSYVHAGSLSAAQIREATDPADQLSFLTGQLGIVNIATAYMIRAWYEVFRVDTDPLESNQAAAEAVSEWVRIGSKRIAEL